jgi:hypothetical protein
VYISKRLFLTLLVAVLGASSLVFALGASGHRAAGSNEAVGLLRSSLAPSLPTDPTIHGVGPGTLPWALSEGSVQLRADGRFQLKVDDLVLTNPPFTGTPGPVNGIAASLFCGADSNTTAASRTGVVPLSHEGDGSIHIRLTVPSTCLAPIVLVNPEIGSTLVTSRYIALTGFRG